MLVKVKALTNGFHKEYQKEGTVFLYDAPVENRKPVLGKWMELIEVIKKKTKAKPKPEAELEEVKKEVE